MKKIILTTLVIVTIFQSLVAQVQETTTPALTNKEKADQLFLKAKHQKDAAWGLLGAGGALVIIGALTSKNDNTSKSFSFQPTGVLSGFSILFGGLSVLSSVPLFISAGSNKNKARLLMESEKLSSIPGKNNLYQGKLGLIVRL